MLKSVEGSAITIGFLGKGNSSGAGPLVEQPRRRRSRLQDPLYDWGSTPGAIRSALSVADEYDVQVCIHTDTLNEAGYVEDTIAAIDGRTIHTYHLEGPAAATLRTSCGCVPSPTCR